MCVMGAFKVIPKEIKDQVLARIKNDGIPVAQAANEHGVNPKTVYNWLRSTATTNPNILEISRLRRENKELKEIIGIITHELHKNKKNQGY